LNLRPLEVTEETLMQPRIERLDQRHAISTFDCGERSFELLLEDLQTQTALGTETATVFVAVEGRDTVVGYIAFSDVEMETSHHQETLRFFFVSALAVGVAWRAQTPFVKNSLALRLIRKAVDVAQARLAAGRHYDGFMAMRHGLPSVERALLNLGFAPIADDAPLLVRTLPEGEVWPPGIGPEWPDEPDE
jgi:predicted N-acetyltransferase YhbS